VLNTEEYQWKSKDAESAFDAGATATLRGWMTIHLYGLKSQESQSALADFREAIGALEKASELEGSTQYPLVGAYLAVANAGLATYHWMRDGKDGTVLPYADRAIELGKTATRLYDQSVGWDRESRSDFHAQMAYAYLASGRGMVQEAKEQLALSQKYGTSLYATIPQKVVGGVESRKGEQEGKKGCFVATAVYGSPMVEEVVALRRFRDNVLQASCLGRTFVRAYYWLSPPLARVVSRNQSLRKALRGVVMKPVLRVVARKQDRRTPTAPRKEMNTWLR
jgi:hypothetical protein